MWFWKHKRLESTSCFFRFSEFFHKILGILQNFWSELEFWMNLTNTAWGTTPRNEFLTKLCKPEKPFLLHSWNFCEMLTKLTIWPKNNIKNFKNQILQQTSSLSCNSKTAEHLESTFNLEVLILTDVFLRLSNVFPKQSNLFSMVAP